MFNLFAVPETYLLQNDPFYSATCVYHKSQYNKLAYSKACYWFEIQISTFSAFLGWILGYHSQNRFIVLSQFLRFRHLSEPSLLYLSLLFAKIFKLYWISFGSSLTCCHTQICVPSKLIALGERNFKSSPLAPSPPPPFFF